MWIKQINDTWIINTTTLAARPKVDGFWYFEQLKKSRKTKAGRQMMCLAPKYENCGECSPESAQTRPQTHEKVKLADIWQFSSKCMKESL